MLIQCVVFVSAPVQKFKTNEKLQCPIFVNKLVNSNTTTIAERKICKQKVSGTMH